MKESIFSSHTKLLLSGEYLVTRGARALALPLKFTQALRITVTDLPGNDLLWKSRELGIVWFEASFNKEDFKINYTTGKQTAANLQRILLSAREINPDFLISAHEIHAETDTDFELKWGMGSSSTLIASVAQWAEINPYVLLQKTFGGSGYDIACAKANSPVFYRLTENQQEVHEAPFHPPFSHRVGFVYLGKKMNSRSSMNQFTKQGKYTEETILRISQISLELTEAPSIEQFESLLEEHELIMAEVLQIQPVKQQLLGDYPFTVKSLGAWGGDFALFTCREPEVASRYFQQKGLQPVFWLPDIVRMVPKPHYQKSSSD